VNSPDFIISPTSSLDFQILLRRDNCQSFKRN